MRRVVCLADSCGCIDNDTFSLKETQNYTSWNCWIIEKQKKNRMNQLHAVTNSNSLNEHTHVTALCDVQRLFCCCFFYYVIGSESYPLFEYVAFLVCSTETVRAALDYKVCPKNGRNHTEIDPIISKCECEMLRWNEFCNNSRFKTRCEAQISKTPTAQRWYYFVTW